MEIKSEVKGSLQIKNNMFYAVLDLKDKNGKRKLKWISTGLSVRGNKRKAEEVLNQLKSEYSLKNATPETQRIDFLDYLKTWLEIRKGSLQETTYDSYRMIIYGKITRYFEPLGLSMDDVQASDIECFFDHMYKSGVTSNTIIHYYSLLMTFFKYAKKKKKIIKENPMEDVDKPVEIQYMASFYSTQEVTEMFEAVKDDVLYTTIILAAFYGLRRSETLGLRWSAIDFEQKTVTINRKVIQTHSEGGSAANIKKLYSKRN